MAFNVGSLLSCKVHPVVLAIITDAHERRASNYRRAIGTLLGTQDKGVVEVTNAFAVPHSEDGEEVAINMDYTQDMVELYRKVNSVENVVGWFSTNGELMFQDVLIHEYYAKECKNPVHLTIDTSLQGNHMSIVAYMSVPMGLPNMSSGTMFTPVVTEITCYDAEEVAVKLLNKSRLAATRQVGLEADVRQVVSAFDNLARLKDIIDYIRKVQSNELPGDSAIGRQLMALVESAPQLAGDEFKEILNSGLKDMLMVMYLTKLTQTQIRVNEKAAVYSR